MSKEMTTRRKRVWVCDLCGSDDVFREAAVPMNAPKDISVYDRILCGGCGTEAKSVSHILR